VAVVSRGLGLAKRADSALVRVLKLLGALSCLPRTPIRLLHRLQGTFCQYRFGLAAVLIPLGIRAAPEILVGPYPIGFDTIAFYVPNTSDWAVEKAGLSEAPWNPSGHSCKTLLNESQQFIIWEKRWRR